jgi:LysM repeat protein
MMIDVRRPVRLLPAAALAILAACSGHAPRPQTPAAVAPTENEIDAIQTLLMQGDTKAARSRLKAVLKRDPMNASALVLRNSIDGDAKAQLGAESFAYTVRPGDTMLDLSQRFLGTKLKAYQLARYNGIDNPSTLAPDQVLHIPGEAPRSAPPRTPSEPARPHVQPQQERPKPAAKPAPVPPPAAPAANPVAARQARAAGLAALNQGNVARAVAMLRRARALDPSNPLIARDLARAERIATTVRARR